MSGNAACRSRREDRLLVVAVSGEVIERDRWGEVHSQAISFSVLAQSIRVMVTV